MFKKKPIYIIGIVVFTLILIADLLLFFLVPKGSDRVSGANMGGSFNMQRPDADNMPQSGEDFTMPEDFDASDMAGIGGSNRPEGSEDFTMPEDFDASDMAGGFGGSGRPGGSEDFTMPEDFDASDMAGDFGGSGRPGGSTDFTVPDGFDSSDLPEDFDMSGMSMPGQRGDQQNSKLRSVISKIFWPVLIVGILGDALCIFMLIRVSKKKQMNQEEIDEEDDDQPPRRDHTNTFLAVIAVLVVGGVILTSLPSGQTGTVIETEISVEQAEVSRMDLVNSFSGSGTLSSTEASEMEIPAGVTISSYTVKNGDMVQAGDVIANVDKTSVLNTVYELQTLMAQMDEEIAEVQSDTLDDEITARADGRVKAIYVTEGDSVAAAMYENGAVMLISLGGSMTVVIESEETVSVGQTLTVTLSNETRIEGKVQQVRDGKITVTTTDNGPTPDDTVSVATEDGTDLGTGTLRISSALKVTSFFGTVDSIQVEVGDKVETGDTLLTLLDTEDVARYQQLLRQREELTELVNQLNVMYQEGTVKASASGVISQISDDAVYSGNTEEESDSTETLSTASESSVAGTLSTVSNGNSVSTLSSASSGSFRIGNLSSVSSNGTMGISNSFALFSVTDLDPTGQTDPISGTDPEMGSDPVGGGMAPEGGEELSDSEEESSGGGEALPDGGDDLSNSGEELSNSGEVFPGGGEDLSNGGEVLSNGSESLPSSGENLPGGSEMLPSVSEDFPDQRQVDGTYAGKVTKVTYGAFHIQISETDRTGDTAAVLESLEEDTLTTEMQYSPELTISVNLYLNGQLFPSSLSAIQAGDKVLIRIENGAVTQIDYMQGTVEATPSQESSNNNSMSSAFPSAGVSYIIQTNTEDEETAEYTVEKTSLCAIIPAETMTIDVSVDELDILSLSVGQEAAITLDALPGQSFTGTVKKINSTGTNDGGSTKYTVTMEVPRTEQMLDGMNASVRIEVSCLDSVLAVPAAAIYEDGNRTYVYTALDEKSGDPANPVDVITGASDGSNVEILSGLDAGATVYYSYAASIVYRFAGE